MVKDGAALCDQPVFSGCSTERNGLDQGRRPDLIGGGLIRSVGGWAAIEDLRRAGIHLKSDERILGDSDFVENALAEAQESMQRKYALAALL
ncbi:hypothetical protein ACFL0Q_01620 [Thermodesulfobacteriota bacterium]